MLTTLRRGARTCVSTSCPISLRQSTAPWSAMLTPFCSAKRPAYRFTVKHSIYVHPDHLSIGIGTRFALCHDSGVRRRRLPPDDRLYRQRQCRLAAAARNLRLSSGRLSASGSPCGSANGPTPYWFSGRSARRFEPLGCRMAVGRRSNSSGTTWMRPCTNPLRGRALRRDRA